MTRGWKFAAALAGVLAAGSASAQADGAKAECPATAQELSTKSLYGRWDATIDGQPGIATVELGKHPEYDGVRGTVQRAGQPPAQLAGDIDPDGLLALDESQDGRSISASWSGEMQAGSCGKEFKGTWRKASDDSTHAFVLHKAGSWK